MYSKIKDRSSFVCTGKLMELTNKIKQKNLHQLEGLVWLQNTRLTYKNQLYFYTPAKKREIKTLLQQQNIKHLGSNPSRDT